jgi:hypothetical protein
MRVVSEWYNDEKLEQRNMRTDGVKGMAGGLLRVVLSTRSLARSHPSEQTSRLPFCSSAGPHRGANTIVYSMPGTGWNMDYGWEHLQLITKTSQRTNIHHSEESAALQTHVVPKREVVKLGLIVPAS